ncbi:DUF4164 domain-containing protein [Sphingomonas lenta]|nr:DUF4164 domain-containing protein [Sphingomonas lenta]
MNIDDALQRLAAAPTHPGLDGLESAVFARIEAERDARAGPPIRIGIITAAAAALLGTAGAVLPTGEAKASASALAPFGASSPLAPSTLLATGP